MHQAAGENPAGARSGLGCIAVGCHLDGQLGAGASAFAFAGTVYKESAGTNVAPGVTVRMFAVGGQKSLASAATDDNGNFVIRGAFTAFPYETHVTGCGNSQEIVAMGGRITNQAEANCSNTGTCHAKEGGATPVYLPD